MIDAYLSELQQVIHRQFCQQLQTQAISLGDIKFQAPPQPDLGEFCIPCFPFAKMLGKNPNEVARLAAQNFVGHPYIQEIQAVGPYLNVKVHRDQFARILCLNILQKQQEFGRSNEGQGVRVMIEYSSPNTNKPLHIGHVRNNLIGMALANIFEFCGYALIKSNLINDRGIHICKSLFVYRKWHPEIESPESIGMKGDHLVGKFYVEFENALRNEREAYAQKKGIDLRRFHKDYAKDLKQRIRDAKDPVEKQKLNQELQQLQQESDAFEEEFLANSEYYQAAMELLRRWEQEDPEVRRDWQKLDQWVIAGFQETYRILGCKFDKIYRESQTYMLGKEHVLDGLNRGIFYRKEDGSIWVSAQRLMEIDPEGFKGFPLKDKVLLRGDGTSVYITQDIGTAILKAQEYNLQRSIYVVASEQALHFKTLFAILKLLGFAWAPGCYHAAYGMVTLPKGMGKIKSREGTAVDADDLIAEMKERAKEKMTEENLRVPEEQVEQISLDIALAALKVFILQVSNEKDLQFDPTQTIAFTGDTGPAIQYSYARIQSIFRKAAEQNIPWPAESQVDYSLLKSPEEFALIRQLWEFPEIIKTITRTYNIGLLVNYLLALTKTYASVYTEHPVLRAETESLRAARLILAKATAQVIHNGMALLGVQVPERM